MRDIIITSIIAGFFLTYMKWDYIYTGIINWIIASVFSFALLFLLFLIIKVVAKHYGYTVSIVPYYATWEKKYFDYFKREVISKVRKIPLGYLIMIILGFLSSGFLFFPIGYTYKFSIIESWRIGKTKETDAKFSERIKIILISLIIIWFIISLLKYFTNNFFISGVFWYMYHLLTLLTIAYAIPFNLLLSYFVVEKLNGGFSGSTPGDLFIFSEKPFYKASIIIILLLSFLSILLNPAIMIIVFLIAGFYIWLREKYNLFIS